ncbi:MAG: alpha amylase N-terminal ig-like domain-containing protein [Candidatus Promineifilaceae bacterium]|nr:alpha amylase N-terminal ig-like domain-containing protein [Candidatus Promineifilaceae bacterium]
MKSKSGLIWPVMLGALMCALLLALLGTGGGAESALAEADPAAPAQDLWVVAGDFQSEISTCGDWTNTCDATLMEDENGDGVYRFVTDTIPAGNYEYKVVEYDNWGNAYPASNVSLAADGGEVRFYFNPDTGMVADSINQCIATVAGNFQSTFGGNDWDPANLRTMMWQESPGSDNYIFRAIIPAGSWEYKVALDEDWAESYPANNVSLNLAAPTEVTFMYNCDTNAVSHEIGGDAAHDDDVWWNDLGHNSRMALYRTPQGPVTTGVSVTVRLRAAAGDLTEARVRVWDDYLDAQFVLDMERVAVDDTYEWWEATIPASDIETIYWYRFIAIDGSATAYYEDDADRDGGWGATFGESPDNSWQLTVYDPAFETPEWVKNAIIYQIFTDRFRDGGWPDPPAGRFFYDELDGTIYRSNESEWNTVICDPRDAEDCPGTYSLNFYGGDLPGILEKMDYLQSIGITALYLNPIFESPSNHKYDTSDFTQISSDFGDLDTFKTLVNEAHSRGMHVILDGVFNHTSSDSIYFDRYSNFDTLGACESVASPYRDWYFFTDVTPGTGACVGSDGTANAADYESWFGFDSLPKLNAQNQEVRDFFYAGGEDAIGRYWLSLPADATTTGADGWRLDVGGDVDPGWTRDPDNNYWEQFRDAVRSVDPDAYIVIEEWGNATPWTLGEEMDATMNYQFSTAMLGFWRDTAFTDNDHNPGSSAGVIEPLSPSELDNRLRNWIERYPEPALYAMMNLLGSHDTNRPLFFLDHNAVEVVDSEEDPNPLLDPNYDWSDQIHRQKGVWILQMTLPGAPTTYYGDEVGLVGPTYYYGGKWEDDPYNRQPFPWLDESGTPFYQHLQTPEGQDELRSFYTMLTTARNNHPALRTGSFDTLLIDDANELYAYGRLMDDYSDAAVVIVNRAGEIDNGITQTVTLDVSGYLPYGAEFEDVLSGDTYTVGMDGSLVVEVPGELGAVLVLSQPLNVSEPAAPNNLMVTNTTRDSASLVWNGVAGADSYNVYRSLVSGGGYTLVANTNATTYSDTGLEVATDYFYVVTSVDESTGLESGFSNEVLAVPAYDMGAAWYNLQWPPEMTHTISAVTPTDNIYGQIWIDGVTSEPGPAPGLLEQVGFGPTGTTPLTADWTWVSMAFNTDVGNNDEYFGQLLPENTGDYHYVTRWSGDGGRTWFYSDQGGPDDPSDGFNEPGVLHVVAADDTVAPEAPEALRVAGTTASSIILEWAPSDAPDLAGYWIYRANIDPARPARLAPEAVSYERIATVDAGVTRYVDEQVQTNATYAYYVRAFDEHFNVSPRSNIVSATAERLLVDVTFRVRVPEATPDQDLVYLVGDIPDLGPWDPGLWPMTRVAPQIWETTLTIPDGTELQYKYTRGSWERVESWGTIVNLANRHVMIQYGDTGEQLVDNTATDWGVGPDDEKAVRYWVDPLVESFYPPEDAQGVSRDTVISVTWSISMATDTDFEVAGPTGAVAGTFTQDATTNTTIFVPDAPLAATEMYTVVVDGEVAMNGGKQQHPVEWSFVTGPEEVTLHVRKMAHAELVSPGAPVTYTIVVTNAGPDVATSVTLTDTLPAVMTFVSADVDVGTCTATGITVVCDIGILAANGTATATIVALAPNNEDTLTNEVVATADQFPLVSVENSDTEVVDVVRTVFELFLPVIFK